MLQLKQCHELKDHSYEPSKTFVLKCHVVWIVPYELQVSTTSSKIIQQELVASQSRVGKISINFGRDELVCSS